MSSDPASAFDPYQAPESFEVPHPSPGSPGPLPTQMDYFQAYAYIFEHPQWMTTVGLLGILGIVNFIPLLNLLYALLLCGYAFSVLDNLLASGGARYPAFDFDRIQDYFTRGLWPFLVYLIGSVVIGLFFYVLLMGLALVGVALAFALGEQAAGIFIAVFSLIFFPVLACLAIVGSAAVGLMALRSGLARDFAAGFDYRWALDFLRKMWWELLVAGLFFLVSTLALEVLGLLALCVGILFVIPIAALAGTHLIYQLYGVYLSRGGMPVTVVTH